MKIEELKSKKVAIVGLGIEGIATGEYLLKHQIPFAIFDEKSEDELQEVSVAWKHAIEVFQSKGVQLVFGKQLTSDMLSDCAVVMRSPGISLKNPVFEGFSGIISSQTKLFFDNCPAKIIGVTGTKGKGTTSTLIYEMLKKAGKDAYLGGNIGVAPIVFLDDLTAASVVVLELSSFQLEDLTKSPHIGVMLMVTQEHLDAVGHQNYHESIQAYQSAKTNMFRFQTVDDMAVINPDYPGGVYATEQVKGKIAFVSRYKEVKNGCFVENNEIILRWEGVEARVISIFDILLPGRHNLENVCAAIMAAHSLGVSLDDVRFVLNTFKGLEHRLELVREIDEVKYYDDSFSTVPETAIAAIEAFSSPEILLLGGSSKNSDFTTLGEILSQSTHVKAVIVIGTEWEKIKSFVKNPSFQIIEGLTDMKEFVEKAHALAKPGDIVLLSPACASFDKFKNYKDRGNQFKEQVNLL